MPAPGAGRLAAGLDLDAQAGLGGPVARAGEPSSGSPAARPGRWRARQAFDAGRFGSSGRAGPSG